MRLDSFVNELKSGWGAGLTALDIDETILQTKALIYVMRDGKIVKKLNNQEFNTYKPEDGETFDFREFRDAELFAKTSIPIPKVVERIKRMFKNIDIRGSKVIFLTARADFDKKDVFLSTFSNLGIPISDIYVERAGNMTTGTVASRKKEILMKYINTGKYRRVRLIDDDIHNLKSFLSLKNELPQSLIDKVKSTYNIGDDEKLNPIEFYALQVVDSEGRLRRITESYEGLTNVMVALEIASGCHNTHINEGFMDSVSSMVNKMRGIAKSADIEVEKGLLSYMKDVGVGGSQMLYHAFNAFYNKNEESKTKIKELSQGVKKEHLIDVLMKLDVLTLHLITGPLHMIEAVTGWNILSHIKAKVEPVEKQAKQAIHSLENLGKSLDSKLKAQVQTYANAIRRVFGLGEFKKINETTAVGNIGYYPSEIPGAVGSFGGPDNLIGANPEWMHPPAHKKMSLENFFVISNQQDWDDFFSSFWVHGANTEEVERDPGLSDWGKRFVAEETVGADVAVPDALIGGDPGVAPSMVKRLDKKKKKRKSLEDLVKDNV